ncbi:MAG: traD [Gammaproteobacteria bacterium]|jgi:conjugative coupling factor TraD (TOL family)|nr:traD [Gammaproteobacteria bacterium]
MQPAKTKHTVEMWLRKPVEVYSSIVFCLSGYVVVEYPGLFLLNPQQASVAAGLLLIASFYRGYQGYQVYRYQRGLLSLSTFSMSTKEVPLSKKWLYLGKGFRWQAHHSQRLYFINQIKNEAYIIPNKLYRLARKAEQSLPPSHWLHRLLHSQSRLNPLRPLPDIGGKPWLHGVGNHEETIRIPQHQRNGHILVLGTTRVGKTRLASILINQDIRNGEAVIVLDPKGDLELMRDIYSAANAANRLDDVYCLHAGFSEVSARYNPLATFSDISEVATRVVSGMSSSSGDDVFKDFAWKYVNIVAHCLFEMGRPLNYKNIAFFVTHLDDLLVAYMTTVVLPQYPEIQPILDRIQSAHSAKLDKKGNPVSPMQQADVIKECINTLLEQHSQNKENDQSWLFSTILLSLQDAANMNKEYYDKITASLSPALDKINQGSGASLFSFDDDSTHLHNKEINLMEVIKERKIVYIGLDAMSNKVLAQAVGKALIADLVSTVGRLYKQSSTNQSAPHSLCLHADEFSDIIESQFVTLLNKAGGAGVKVIAYSQTLQDIESGFGGNHALAKMTEGNLNTLIMLRVKNRETAELLINQLPSVDILTPSQVSRVSDTPQGVDGVYFHTSNEDRVERVSVPMLSVNDIVSLPKGQAFVFVNGGELYKIRMPLPKNDNLAPNDMETLMQSVNRLTVNANTPS